MVIIRVLEQRITGELSVGNAPTIGPNPGFYS